MDIFELYRQRGVRHATEGEKHTTRGWVNCACPFCGSVGGALHLGFDLEKRFFHCWRCGSLRTIETLAALLNVSRDEARAIAHEISPSRGLGPRRDADRRVSLSRYARPPDIGELRRVHRRYLEARGFDPDEVSRAWGVAATGPASYLSEIDYRHRLFIPVTWEGREVSFQTRDVTGKAKQKYKACPAHLETVHHKDIIYGQHAYWQGRVGIAVEGVTDVWRLGPDAFALFGIQFKTEQVVAISRADFARVVIVFDGEWRAQLQADKLRYQLEAVGVEASLYELGKDADPGSLSQADAAHLVREVTTVYA